MEQEQAPHALHQQAEPQSASASSPDKQPWQEPKVAFVEPKLTAHGTLTEVTAQGGFFGTFTP
jgi:hypothetical protein